MNTRLHASLFVLCLAGGTVGAASPDNVLLNAPFITGSHYNIRQLTPTYADHVGQPVTGDLVEAIRRELQSIYERDGFVVPMIVTENELSGTPRLHVFEARIDEVIIQGNAGPHRRTVERLAAELQSQASMHKTRTQDVLRRINELPGLQVKSTFPQRAAAPNSYALQLDLRYEPLSANMYLSNRGTADIGYNLLSGRMQLNGTLGLQETLSLTAASSTHFDRYHYFAARMERRFGGVGVDVAASRTRANTDPDSFYQAERYAIEATSTAWQRNAWRIEPLAALGARESAGRDAQGIPDSLTRTRSAELGFQISGRGASSNTRMRASVVRGLDAWSALVYRRYGEAAEAEFNKGALEFTHSRTLQPGWQLRVDLDGQWSRADLPPGERFTFGGSRFGRAFDPGDLVSDSGAAVSLQLDRSQRWSNQWLESGRAFLQADYGVGWSNESGSRNEDRGASITAGLGARTNALQGTLELGYPLQRPEDTSTRDKDLRAFLGLQLIF